MKKTIYIKPDEAFIYDEAERVTGENISRIIVKALKEYISRFTASEIKLKAGYDGKTKSIVFNGIKVAERKESGSERSIYRMDNRKFLIAWTQDGVSDYIIVDDIPDVSTTLYGTVTGLPYEFGASTVADLERNKE